MIDFLIILLVTSMVVLIDYSSGVSFVPDAKEVLQRAGFPDYSIDTLIGTTERMLGYPKEELELRLLYQGVNPEIISYYVNHWKDKVFVEGENSKGSSSKLVVKTRGKTGDRYYPIGSGTEETRRETDGESHSSGSETSRIRSVNSVSDNKKRQSGDMTFTEHTAWIRKAGEDLHLSQKVVIELEQKLPYLDEESRFARYPNLAAVLGTSMNFKDLRTVQNHRNEYIKSINKSRKKMKRKQ